MTSDRPDVGGDIFAVDENILLRKEQLSRSFRIATVAFLKIQNRIREFETEFEISPSRACCELGRMHTQINEFSDRYCRFVCAGRSFLDQCNVQTGDIINEEKTKQNTGVDGTD